MTIQTIQTEVLVLGSGPGGYSAAFRATDLGKSVMLVEEHKQLGGVCLNVGCIPSKTLLHVQRIIDDAASLSAQGIVFGQPSIDTKKLSDYKNKIIKQLTSGLSALAKKRKVTLLQGQGQFNSPETLAVTTPTGQTQIVQFKQAIIAAGSRPITLPFLPSDDPRIMDSTKALALEETHCKLLIIGGGIIGLEMAMIYHALGAEITIVEVRDQLIPGTDADLVTPLYDRLSHSLQAIYLHTKVSQVTAKKAGLEVTFIDQEGKPSQVMFDRILCAVGRRPNSDLINLQAATLKVDERGFLVVDQQMRTNVPHLFAIGDIVGQPMLAHKATAQGRLAAEVIAGHDYFFQAKGIPSVAYTDPEIAWVGLLENEAKAKKIAYEVSTFPWAASGRSLSMGRQEGFTKLLFDPQTHRIIGGGIVGPGAGELIAEVTLAIEMGCDVADIALTIHPHPTLSETIAMAAEIFEGTVTDLYLPKKHT